MASVVSTLWAFVYVAVALVGIAPHPLLAASRHSDTTEVYRHRYYNHIAHSFRSESLLDEGSFRNLQNATKDDSQEDEFSRCSEDTDEFLEANPNIQSLYESQDDSIVEKITSPGNGEVVQISIVMLPYTMSEAGETCESEGGIWAASWSKQELLCTSESVGWEALGLDETSKVLIEDVNVGYFGLCYAKTDDCSGLGRLDLLRHSLEVAEGWNCTIAPGVDQAVTATPEFGSGSGIRRFPSTTTMGIVAVCAFLAMVAEFAL